MAINITDTPPQQAAVWDKHVYEGHSTNNLARQIRVTITIGGESVVAYEPTWVEILGQRDFVIDVAPLLRHFFGNILNSSLTSFEMNNAANAYTGFLHEIGGQGDVLDGVAITGVAHRSNGFPITSEATGEEGTLQSPQTGKRIITKADRIPLSAIFPAAEVADWALAVLRPDNSTSAIPHETEETRKLGFYLPFETGKHVARCSHIPSGRISDEYTYYVIDTCYRNDFTLYWLNRRGGFEVYHFPESQTISSRGDSVSFDQKIDGGKNIIRQKLPAKTWEQRQLIGRYETHKSAEYLKDLINSPEVVDRNGTPVYVQSSNINTHSEGEFRPSVQIIRNIETCIGY